MPLPTSMSFSRHALPTSMAHTGLSECKVKPDRDPHDPQLHAHMLQQRTLQALVRGRKGADALLHRHPHAGWFSRKRREANRRDIHPLPREARQPRRQLPDGRVGEAAERPAGHIGRALCATGLRLMSCVGWDAAAQQPVSRIIVAGQGHPQIIGGLTLAIAWRAAA